MTGNHESGLTPTDGVAMILDEARLIPEKVAIRTTLLHSSNCEQQLAEVVMPEQWRTVPGFPEYKVSDHGNVMSLRRNKLMKLGGTHDGYWVVYLVHEGNRKRFAVHRLVIMAFVGPRPEGLHIAHLDGNGKNNHVSNLKYVTQRENMRMRDEHGKTYRGEGSRSRVLSKAAVIEMRLSNEKSIDLARRYGVQYECILRARAGKSWKHLPMDEDELRAMQAEMADSDKHIDDKSLECEHCYAEGTQDCMTDLAPEECKTSDKHTETEVTDSNGVLHVPFTGDLDAAVHAISELQSHLIDERAAHEETRHQLVAAWKIHNDVEHLNNTLRIERDKYQREAELNDAISNGADDAIDALKAENERLKKTINYREGRVEWLRNELEGTGAELDAVKAENERLRKKVSGLTLAGNTLCADVQSRHGSCSITERWDKELSR